MKRAEILSVGTELLMGQIANTNAQYISKRLPEVGVGVYYHSVVGDNPERLRESLSLALSRSDIVFTTGGLGPTQDDLTKETIADALSLPMELHEDSAVAIRDFFARTGREMAESNLRQAYFPKGAYIMDNEEGTAPGCILRTIQGSEEKFVVMLPGPPKELIPMFNRHVIRFFTELHETPLYSRFLRIVGVGESMVEKQLMDLVEGQTNPTLATYAKDGIVTIRVTAHDDRNISGKALVLEMCDTICSILGDHVYASDDEELEVTVHRMLKERNLKFACCESCTGGILSQRMTSIPGASEVFICGAVTYREESKVALANVAPETIAKHSAVSKETALEMVRGILAVSGADVAVSITGYAGPKSGDEPVGLVYIGVIAPGIEMVKAYHFTGNRDRIRNLSVIHALDLIRRSLIA